MVCGVCPSSGVDANRVKEVIATEVAMLADKITGWDEYRGDPEASMKRSRETKAEWNSSNRDRLEQYYITARLKVLKEES